MWIPSADEADCVDKAGCADAAGCADKEGYADAAGCADKAGYADAAGYADKAGYADETGPADGQDMTIKDGCRDNGCVIPSSRQDRLFFGLFVNSWGGIC